MINNIPEDGSTKYLGATRDFEYHGQLGEYEVMLKDFNLYASPSILKINLDSEKSCDLKIYTVIKMRFTVKDIPGYDGTPLELSGALEITDEAAVDPDPEVKKFLKDNLGYTSDSKSRFIKLNVKTTINNIYIEKNSLFPKFKLKLQRTGSDENSDKQLMADRYFEKLKTEKQEIMNLIDYETDTEFIYKGIDKNNRVINFSIKCNNSISTMKLSFLKLEKNLSDRNSLNFIDILYELITGKPSKNIRPDKPIKHEMVLSTDELTTDNESSKVINRIFGGKNEIKCTLSNTGDTLELWDNESFNKSRLHLKW